MNRKKQAAEALTVAALAAALGIVLYRQGTFDARTPSFSAGAPDAPKVGPTPQDAIYAMLDAAREGDVPMYLAAYTGQMQASLQQAVAESGEEKFAAYLKSTNASIKGVAIAEPQALTDREVKVRIEYVYADRNEVQFAYLEKMGNQWRIARLDAAERIKTPVPYGAPVQ